MIRNNGFLCAHIIMLFFLMNTALWCETQYFSPTGEKISKDKYEKDRQEGQIKVNAVNETNQTRDIDRQKTKTLIKAMRTAQGFDMFGNPTDDISEYDSKGRPLHDKYGRRLTYTDSESIPEIKWYSGYPYIKVNDRTWKTISGLRTTVDGHEYIYEMDGWDSDTGKLYKDGKVVRIYKNGNY